ncbi:MAG: universal stress protein [Planctomycetota bacterium]
MNIQDWKRAVVGDDGRDGGDCALAAAGFLRDRLGLDLHVLHSIDVPQMALPGIGNETLMTARADMAERAEAWLKERVEDRLGSGTEFRVELGRPSAALHRAVRSLPAEVLVLGGHVRDSLLDFGGTQRAAFSGSEAHVWSQPTPSVEIERVIAPFDFDDASSEAAATARALADRLDVPLLVLHCSESIGFVDPIPAYAGSAGMPVYVVDAMHKASEARFLGWFQEFAEGAERIEARFEMGSAAVGIAEAQGPKDLVVMGTRGHTGVAAAVLGGVTYSVLKAKRGPVLALRT